MKIKNVLLNICLLLLFIIPLNVLAYSSFVIPGGETVGIEVNSKGVLVVGFYKVNDKYLGKDSGIEIGDTLLKINNKTINNISEMINTINNLESNTVIFTTLRDGKEIDNSLELEMDEGVLKTGLYVKDTITGIGTLTYIDPKTKIFGALGHEIIEKTTADKFLINGGIIFGSNIVGIEKSRDGVAGAKSATYDRSRVFGTIEQNEISGIFGKYNDSLNKQLVEVGNSNAVHTGNATIKTVVTNNNVEEFNINIIRLDDTNDTKNILFEITDTNLLAKTGGIVQGMSGSPIIQDGKLIGAVTHVIVNDSTKGYGIFIETMLKEGEKKRA